MRPSYSIVPDPVLQNTPKVTEKAAVSAAWCEPTPLPPPQLNHLPLTSATPFPPPSSWQPARLIHLTPGEKKRSTSGKWGRVENRAVNLDCGGEWTDRSGGVSSLCQPTCISADAAQHFGFLASPREEKQQPCMWVAIGFAYFLNRRLESLGTLTCFCVELHSKQFYEIMILNALKDKLQVCKVLCETKKWLFKGAWNMNEDAMFTLSWFSTHN